MLDNDWGIGPNSLGELVTGAEGVPPWDDSTEVSPSELESLEEELEIYRKAERFNKLSLLSGNRINGGVTERYIQDHYGVEGLRRYKLAKFVLSNLDYIASPDVLLMLACTNKARIVVATAGAGKTTSLQFDLIISKMVDKATGAGFLKPEQITGTSVYMPRILYLNYNKHNVRMIEERHTAICRAINKLLTDEDAITDEIESSTVHAFCHKWLGAVRQEYSLPDLAIISQTDKEKIWNSIIKPRWKKFYGEGEGSMVSYEVLDDLYTYKTESMLDWEDFYETAKFIDSGLKEEFVRRCITKYDAMKIQLKVMDFTDYLVTMIKVLKEHEDFRRRLQERYSIIIADENQDFTLLMNELLIQLYNPEVNRLVVVGDPDQVIYDFKGVSPDNVVTLSEILPDVQLLGLDTNYRCPDRIVLAAKAILDMNILRFKKPINTVKTGGTIQAHPIHQGENSTAQILQLVNRVGQSDWSNTVITYRNNSSSLIIAEELYYAGIPFKVLDDRRPFNNVVFRHLTTAIRALLIKDDTALNRELYRFLPLSKERWFEILESNRMQRRSHLHDIVIPSDMPQGTTEALGTLIIISKKVETTPVSDYISVLIRLYRLYYFDFIVRQTNFKVNNVENYELYLERAVKFYSRQMTFEYMMAELREKNVDRQVGVTLSTFHGLKGLEFDNVIAIDFNESIFPNYMGLEQRYSKNTAMQERESANRLCYVLVTRAIKEFHMFYNATDPSMYVKVILDAISDTTPIEDTPELTLGSVGGVSEESSMMSFVNRLLGNRG